MIKFQLTADDGTVTYEDPIPEAQAAVILGVQVRAVRRWCQILGADICTLRGQRTYCKSQLREAREQMRATS